MSQNDKHTDHNKILRIQSIHHFICNSSNEKEFRLV